jgi:4-carboxymuconolactone decarboxylase
MTDERRALVRLSAALASRDQDALRAGMEACLRLGIDVEAEEVILQSYLFLGYPLALNAFSLWRELSGDSGGEGIEDDWDTWTKRGSYVCRVVYGGQYEDLRRNVKALHPDMERWMVIEGYGKVLGRPALDLPTRELAIVSLLAVLRTPRQLYSHVRGAVNTGLALEEVEEALREACTFLNEEGSREVWEVWNRLESRLRETRPSPLFGI